MSYSPERIGVVIATQYHGWKSSGVNPLINESQVRGDLAFEMLGEARKAGARTLVLDSEQSSADFRFRLEELRIPHKQRSTRTLSGQRREAIAQMRQSNVDVILLNDPEKISVVRDGLEACSASILDGSADIVIPERDPELFEQTYPASQFAYERKQNIIINRALRKAGIMKNQHPDYDWLIGVRFIANRPEVTDLFLKEYRYRDKRVTDNPDLEKLLDLESWVNGQYIPVVEALVNGLRVESVRIPYVHPSVQTEFENSRDEEFTRKRRMQTKNIVVGTVQGIKFHRGDFRTLIDFVR